MVHVGVDSHKETSQIAVLSEEGELRQHRLVNDVARLEQFFHVFTIDPFEAPDVKAPPGTPVTNFYQRRSWWFQGPEVEGALANIFVPDAFHVNITANDIVKDSIVQTIRESRRMGESLGGRY